MVAVSSGEAEFYGLTDTCFETLCVKELLEWLGFRVVWQCGTDSRGSTGSRAGSTASSSAVAGEAEHADLDRRAALPKVLAAHSTRPRPTAGARLDTRALHT